MENITLIKVHNPFSRSDRDVVPVPCKPGITLFDLRNEHFPLDVDVIISINGRVVPTDELALTYPAKGDHVLFVPAVHEGLWEGIVAIYAIVASAVSAAYTAGWLVPLLLFAGGLVVNLLLSPDKPKLPTLDSADNSQTYSWSPQTTQQPGLPIPKFYGTMRLYGNIISAYLSSSGSKQYSNALIGLCIGPIKRIIPESIKLNDQPYSSFQGVEVYARNGLLNQPVTVPFDDTKTEYSLQVKIVYPTPYLYTTIGQAYDKLEVEVTFPNGLWYQNDNGGFDAKSVVIRIGIRKQGETTWQHITKTPGIFRTSAGGYWSLGRWYRTYNSGSEEYSEWMWKQGATGSSDPYEHTEGEEGFWSESSGGDSYDVNGFWRWIGEPIIYTPTDEFYDYVTISGAQTGVIRQAFFAENLTAGRYEIQVENLSPDQTSIRYGDDCYLTAVREVIYDDFEYPRLALVAVKALGTDQLSGSLRFSCLAEASYVRIWTGTEWIYDASDNPAWCCFDAFSKPVIDAVKSDALLPGYDYYNEETGMSFRVLRYDGMDPSRLDLVKFKDWADFCDELVPDGNGGTEKRITFNAGFDTSTSMWEAAMQICTVGRAIPVWNGTHITVAVDKPGTPVQLFSVGNIGTDSFRETFLKMSDRASSITIDFVNAEKDYQRDTFTIQVPDIPGDVQASISLIGVTKPSEAWRAGMYRLYNNQFITRTVEIDVGLDAIACTIGDIINVQHDVPQWGFGGRLLRYSPNLLSMNQAGVETGTIGLAADLGTLTRDLTKFHSGASSAKIVTTVNGWRLAIIGPLTMGPYSWIWPCAYGETKSFSTYLFVEGTALGFLHIYEFDSGGNVLGSSIGPQISATGSWERTVLNSFTPQNMNCVGVQISIMLSPYGTVYCDDIQWENGPLTNFMLPGTIELDREVTLEAGKSYTIMVRLTDDSIVSRTITNAPGTYTQLTVSSPFATTPQQYDVYAFGETTKVVKPFRVVNISRKQELDCTVSAVEYNESIYGADSGVPVLPTPNYSSLNVLPPVTGLSLDEMILKGNDGSLEDVIDVYFQRPPSEYWDHVEIWYNNGGGWLFSGQAFNFHRIRNVQVGKNYTVAVLTVNTLGDKTKIQNAPQATIFTLGKLDPPSDVTNFAATQNGQFVNFSWTHIEDGDLWGYEIRQGATWESSRAISTGISSNQFSWQAELNGPYRFLIKAIDTSNLYSRNAAIVDSSLHQIDENLNIVLSQDEITKTGGPDGTKTNFVFVDGAIKFLAMPHTLVDTDVPASWTDQTAEISGYAGGVNLSAEYISLPMDTFQIGDTWSRILTTIDAFDRGATDQSYPTRTDQNYPGDTDQHVTMPTDFAVYICYSNDDVTYTAWEQYFGTVQKHFRFVKIKFTVDISSTTGMFKLLNLLCSFDVPDIELFIPNFAVSTGTGNDVSFATYGGHFYTAPFITPILIGGTANKTPVISSKTNTGFHIDLRDKTDASVSGTVDLRVSGY